MRNEKKYELTLSDLQVYIGIASFEALPKDATPEVVDMYNTERKRESSILVRTLRQKKYLPKNTENRFVVR